MVSLILIALAAICNSIMDTVEDFTHYHKSIFGNLKIQYWCKAVSWTNKYKGVPYTKENLRFKFPFAWLANFLDAWHTSKMLMLIFIFLACVSLIVGYTEDIGIMKVNFVGNLWWDIPIYKALWYIAWNGTFTLFYHKIWIKK